MQGYHLHDGGWQQHEEEEIINGHPDKENRKWKPFDTEVDWFRTDLQIAVGHLLGEPIGAAQADW